MWPRLWGQPGLLCRAHAPDDAGLHQEPGFMEQFTIYHCDGPKCAPTYTLTLKFYVPEPPDVTVLGDQVFIGVIKVK
jgi:hypothetical protein